MTALDDSTAVGPRTVLSIPCIPGLSTVELRNVQSSVIHLGKRCLPGRLRLPKADLYAVISGSRAMPSGFDVPATFYKYDDTCRAGRRVELLLVVVVDWG